MGSSLTCIWWLRQRSWYSWMEGMRRVRDYFLSQPTAWPQPPLSRKGSTPDDISLSFSGRFVFIGGRAFSAPCVCHVFLIVNVLSLCLWTGCSHSEVRGLLRDPWGSCWGLWSKEGEWFITLYFYWHCVWLLWFQTVFGIKHLKTWILCWLTLSDRSVWSPWCERELSMVLMSTLKYVYSKI